MDKCEECKYYEPMNGQGYCKEDAPHISSTIAGSTGIWPVVHGDDKACGKFSKILPT